MLFEITHKARISADTRDGARKLYALHWKEDYYCWWETEIKELKRYEKNENETPAGK